MAQSPWDLVCAPLYLAPLALSVPLPLPLSPTISPSVSLYISLSPYISLSLSLYLSLPTHFHVFVFQTLFLFWVLSLSLSLYLSVSGQALLQSTFLSLTLTECLSVQLAMVLIHDFPSSVGVHDLPPIRLLTMMWMRNAEGNLRRANEERKKSTSISKQQRETQKEDHGKRSNALDSEVSK